MKFKSRVMLPKPDIFAQKQKPYLKMRSIALKKRGLSSKERKLAIVFDTFRIRKDFPNLSDAELRVVAGIKSANSLERKKAQDLIRLKYESVINKSRRGRDIHAAVHFLSLIGSQKSAGALKKAFSRKIGNELISVDMFDLWSRLENRTKVVQFMMDYIKKYNNRSHNSYLLAESIKRIAELGQQDAKILIRKILEKHPSHYHFNYDVHYSACWALGELGDKGAVKLLVKQLRNSNMLIGDSAYLALKKLGVNIDRYQFNKY